MNWSVNNFINNIKDMPHPHDNKQEYQCVSKYFKGVSNGHLKTAIKIRNTARFSVS